MQICFHYLKHTIFWKFQWMHNLYWTKMFFWRQPRNVLSTFKFGKCWLGWKNTQLYILIYLSKWNNCRNIFIINHSFPAGVYIFKVNNVNTRTMCQICSNLIIMTVEQPQWHQWQRSGVCHSVLLILNRFHSFLWFFHLWLWTSKYSTI